MWMSNNWQNINFDGSKVWNAFPGDCVTPSVDRLRESQYLFQAGLWTQNKSFISIIKIGMTFWPQKDWFLKRKKMEIYKNYIIILCTGKSPTETIFFTLKSIRLLCFIVLLFGTSIVENERQTTLSLLLYTV